MSKSSYNCPVCLGLKMKKLKLPKKGPLVLDFCRSCGGVWFDYGEVEKLRSLHSKSSAFFISKIKPSRETFRMNCHSCFSFIDRNTLTCSKCGWKNILDCPVCQKPMKVIRQFSLQTDYCMACKGVWFDNKELSEIWNGQLDKIAHKHKNISKNQNKTFSGIDAPGLFVDLLTYNPEIFVHGTEAAVNLGKSAIYAIPEAPEISKGIIEVTGKLASGVVEGLDDAAGGIVEGLGDAAGGVVEGLGDVAGSVFGSIADIISGIFS